MRQIYGTAINVQQPIIGRITRNVYGWRFDSPILITDHIPKWTIGLGAILSTADEYPLKSQGGKPAVIQLLSTDLSQLHENDIVQILPSGRIIQLWEALVPCNAIMVSHQCNCRCIMCPQPSSVDATDIFQENMRILSLARRTETSQIAFTGGEPTLRIHDLAKMLAYCKHHYPKTSCIILTNGRVLCDFDKVKQLATVGHQNLVYAVALQADIPSLHDQIMGAQGCFNDLMLGLHNLARFYQRIEIRVVLQRSNINRLPQIAEYIYRNIPYASHIAFMGLEIIGLAKEHSEQIWIDPYDYRDKLHTAIQILQQRSLNVSIYNIPYCLLPVTIWPFVRDSISEWKKSYLATCEICEKYGHCPGVFTTSSRQSNYIAPVIAES